MNNKYLFIAILLFAIGINLLSIEYDDVFDLKQNGPALAFTALSTVLLFYYLLKKDKPKN